MIMMPKVICKQRYLSSKHHDLSSFGSLAQKGHLYQTVGVREFSGFPADGVWRTQPEFIQTPSASLYSEELKVPSG